jgi:hypothetical protein
MALQTPWRPITPQVLDELPDVAGVFELGSLVRSVLWVGGDGAVGLRSAIGAAVLDTRVRHLVRYLRFEPATDPGARQRELLSEYRASHHGALPPAQPPGPPTLYPVASPERDPGAEELAGEVVVVPGLHESHLTNVTSFLRRRYVA